MSTNSLTSTSLHLLTFLLNIWPAEVVSGWSAYQQSCSPYQDQYNNYNSCDPYAFLSCERSRDVRSRNDHVCICSSPEYIWVPMVGRCTLRVGSQCFLGPLGGRLGSNKYPDCPPNSFCDIRSGTYPTCKCHSNHFPNSDGSACNKGSGSLHHLNNKGLPWLRLLLPFALTLNYWRRDT